MVEQRDGTHASADIMRHRRRLIKPASLTNKESIKKILVYFLPHNGSIAHLTMLFNEETSDQYRRVGSIVAEGGVRQRRHVMGGAGSSNTGGQQGALPHRKLAGYIVNPQPHHTEEMKVIFPASLPCLLDTGNLMQSELCHQPDNL